MDDATANTTPLLNGEIGQTVTLVLLTRGVLRGAVRQAQLVACSVS